MGSPKISYRISVADLVRSTETDFEDLARRFPERIQFHPDEPATVAAREAAVRSLRGVVASIANTKPSCANLKALGNTQVEFGVRGIPVEAEVRASVELQVILHEISHRAVD